MKGLWGASIRVVRTDHVCGGWLATCSTHTPTHTPYLPCWIVIFKIYKILHKPGVYLAQSKTLIRRFKDGLQSLVLQRESSILENPK